MRRGRAAAVGLLRAFELAGTVGVEARLQPVHAELVARLAFGRIGQRIVGERDALEPLFGLAVPD
jgi:hypothetical protein